MTAPNAASVRVDLPTQALDLAASFIVAVHDYDEALCAELFASTDAAGLRMAVVALAAMVDDRKTVRELLSWTDEPGNAGRLRREWRHALTDVECQEWHNAYQQGDCSEEAEDGHREYLRRRDSQRRWREKREGEVAA